MKQYIKFFIFLGFVALLSSLVYNIQSYYYVDGRVASVHENTIYIADSHGNIYGYETENAFYFDKGDKVTMKIFDNETEHDIDDDVVVNVKRAN